MITESMKNKIKHVRKLKVENTDRLAYQFNSETNALYVPVSETIFTEMFSHCDIEEIELCIDNEIEKAEYMFNTCIFLRKIKFTKTLNLEKVHRLYGMFNLCCSLETIDASSLITSNKLSSISCMFSDCNSLKEVNFGTNFHSENVLYANQLFYCCYCLEDIKWLNYQPFNKLEKVEKAFYDCKKLKQIDLRGVNFSNDVSAFNTFNGANQELEVLVNSTFKESILKSSV